MDRGRSFPGFLPSSDHIWGPIYWNIHSLKKNDQNRSKTGIPLKFNHKIIDRSFQNVTKTFGNRLVTFLWHLQHVCRLVCGKLTIENCTLVRFDAILRGRWIVKWLLPLKDCCPRIRSSWQNDANRFLVTWSNDIEWTILFCNVFNKLLEHRNAENDMIGSFFLRKTPHQTWILLKFPKMNHFFCMLRYATEG